jgi:hypothetical protein
MYFLFKLRINGLHPVANWILPSFSNAPDELDPQCISIQPYLLPSLPFVQRLEEQLRLVQLRFSFHLLALGRIMVSPSSSSARCILFALPLTIPVAICCLRCQSIY